MTGKFKLPHPFFLICGLGILLYARTLQFDYTNFDDNTLIQDNQSYISDLSNLGDAFKRSVFITLSDVFYRPLETVWFMLNAQLGGDDLFVYHLSSMLLHFFAAFLLFTLLKRFHSADTSILLSLVFLVHPVLTQAVAWVPGVVDVLAMIFAISSFHFFLDFIESQQRKHFVLHLLFFALTLYTKEIAVGLCVVCLAFLHLVKREEWVSYNKKVLSAGWGIVLVVWFVMRDAALQDQGSKNIFEMAASIPGNLPVIVQYIGKCLFPFNLSVMPVQADTTYIFGVLAICVLAAAVYFSKNKKGYWLLFAAVWFFAFLLPSMMQTSTHRVYQAYEHRMYLPMVGFLFLIAETDWLKNFSLGNVRARIIAPAVLIFLFVLAFRHVPVFSSTKSFLDNAVATSPGSSLAHRNMGIYYQDKNLLKEAEEAYRKSLAINPHEKDLHNNLGVIYDTWGKKDLAEKEYLMEANMNPSNGQALHNLGVLYAARDENERAEQYFKKALSVRENRGSWEQLALLYKKTGKQKELLSVIERLKAMEAASGRTQGGIVQEEAPRELVSDPIALGRQLMQQGKMQEAENVFGQVLSRDSMNMQALFNLGLIYYSSRQIEVAEKLWRKAVDIDSSFTDASNNLAIALAQQGKKSDAETVLKRIVSSNPNYSDGYFNLANFYAREGKEKEGLFYLNELKKRGITRENFLKRGIKLSPELDALFEKL